MYIDARKLRFGPLTDSEINRDRSFTKKVYSDWFTNNLDDIINRLWEIDDIGVIERVGDFTKLIKEAEFTFSIGAYRSAIALIGISAEDLCRFFSVISGHNLDSETQFNRINRLNNLGLISDDIKNRFHKIRGLRNDCLHFNQSFKSKDDSQLKSDAIESINELKKIYSTLIGALNLQSINPQNLSSIVSKISEEAAKNSIDGIKGVDDALLRTRNIFQAVTGINLSLNLGATPEIRWSIYKVDEIDLDMNPPEISLLDQANGIPVIVDLQREQIEFLNSKKITIGDTLICYLVSVTNQLGTTAIWNFGSKPIQII